MSFKIDTNNADLVPASFNFNVNDPGFLGGQNFHNLLIILILLLVVRR